MLGSPSRGLGILRDGALRALPIWLGITLLAGNFLAAASVYRAARYEAPAPPHLLLVLTLWLPIAAFLLLGRSRARAHRLELALPIPARRLWLSHCLAMACAAAAMLVAAFGMMALVGLLLARFYGGPEPATVLAPLAPPMIAAATLGILLVQSTQPSAWRPVAGGGGWVRLIAGLALVPVALLLLEPWPLAATGLLLLLAGALGWRTWTALPAALELSPMVERAKDDGHGRPTEDDRVANLIAGPKTGPAPVARLLFRILHNAPPWRQAMPWVLYFFIALVGFFLAGGFAGWLDLDESRLMNLPLGAYMLFTGAGILSYHLYRLDPLPISRRLIFRVLVLPSMLLFCLGWGAGRWALDAAGGSTPRVDYRIARGHQRVRVDAAYMGIATDGEAPMLESPWGESHRAWHRPLFRGGSLVVFSPFNTPEPSSARFEALMTSRAIERVHGVSIPPDEVLRRYFVVENDELVALKGTGLDLPAEVSEPAALRRAAESPVYLSLTLVPWLLLLAGFVRSFRATASTRAIRGVYWIGLAALLAVLIGQVIAAVTRLYSPDAAYALLIIFCQRVSASPLATALAWLVCVGLVTLAYRLALAQFRRAELPVSPLQCSPVDWGKGG